MQALLFSLMPNPILFAITGKLSAGKNTVKLHNECTLRQHFPNH